MFKKSTIQITKMKYFLSSIILIFILQSCLSWKKELVQNGNYEAAIKNAIIDFSHSSYATKNRTYIIGFREYKTNIIGVSILEDDNKIYIVNGSPLGRLKDQYIEYNGKLFYWYDEKKGKDSNIKKKLLEYNVIKRVDSLTENMGYIRDDAKKAINYYFCKNNLSIYKKEKTSVAMPREMKNDLNCK